MYRSNTCRLNKAGKKIGGHGHHDTIWMNYLSIRKHQTKKSARQTTRLEIIASR